MPFISCRCRLTKVLAGAASGRKGNKGGGGWVRLSSFDTRRLSGLKYKLICLSNWWRTWVGWHPVVCEWHRQTSIPGKGADGIGCGWVQVDHSSRPCKWTGVHLHVSRAPDLFLQCEMHYISYIEVRWYMTMLDIFQCNHWWNSE